MILTTLLLVCLLGVSAVSCAGPAAAYDGTALGPCPGSPNCVCSEGDAGQDFFVAPFPVPSGMAPGDAFEALAGLISEMASIETRQPDYLHAVFKTRLLRFRDDLEARLDADAGLIHVRSASRLGHSDLGANRRRVENLRASLNARLGDRIK